MNGLLVRMTAQQAKALANRPAGKREIGKGLKSDALAVLEEGSAIIGCDLHATRWEVTLTARIASVPKRQGWPKVRDVVAHLLSRSWELPEGYPSSRTFEEGTAEVLSTDAHVHACLLGSRALVRARVPKLRGFDLDKAALDGLFVTFSGGQILARSWAALQRSVLEDPTAYEAVLGRFLRDLARKGREFEQILEELFASEGFRFYVVKRTPDSGDQGVDLVLQTKHELVGVEQYVVQAKNQDQQVDGDAVRALKQAAADFGAAKAIFVAPNGFAPEAKRQADEGVILMDLEALTPLVWRWLAQMPYTQRRFRAWRDDLKARGETSPTLSRRR
jgi:Holliday junction resolvase